jgi:hypothetical protein
MTRVGERWVKVQKVRRESERVVVRIVARRYVERW